MSVEIRRIDSDPVNPKRWPFKGLSGSGGVLRITDLPPGDYWLEAHHLGLSAADFCFHVKKFAGLTAKSRLKYEWGEMPFGVASASGELIDSQPGTSDSPLWNLTHKIYKPIADANVTLTDPFTGVTLRATSGPQGAFAFAAPAPATYMLHVEEGATPSGRSYQPLDLLIRIDAKASTQKLRLVRRDFGGGSCVDSGLQIEK